jgi:hypothetical protein
LRQIASRIRLGQKSIESSNAVDPCGSAHREGLARIIRTRTVGREPNQDVIAHFDPGSLSGRRSAACGPAMLVDRGAATLEHRRPHQDSRIRHL